VSARAPDPSQGHSHAYWSDPDDLEVIWITRGTDVPGVIARIAEVCSSVGLEVTDVRRRACDFLEHCIAGLESAALPGDVLELHHPESNPRRARARVTFVPGPAGSVAVAVVQVKRDPADAELLESRGLTATEASVLSLVAQGLSDTQVAHRLTLSVRTVNNNLHRIYKKLGVNGRAGAVAWAYRGCGALARREPAAARSSEEASQRAKML
jgi:DNA-binding CsgD family transcriptional regulator